MQRRPAGQLIAKRLLREKKIAGSWRALHDEWYPEIPAGTLCRIALSHGTYLPKRLDYRLALGIKASPCPTCHKLLTTPRAVRTWRHLEDLTIPQLRFVIEHREEIPA